ncbi:MAG: hypothetical protein AABY15_03110 [Nanoarchaeota archaeon]
MRKRLFQLIIITIVLTIIMSLSSCGNDDAQRILEEAYFEGQKDAINGDVRIKKNHDGCWKWTKSPWDNGMSPVFNPSVCDGNNEPIIHIKAQMKF